MRLPRRVAGRPGRIAIVAAASLLAAGAGIHLAQVADAQGCPARLVSTSGPLKVRLVVENGAQAAALDPSALAAYLTDRTGRAVQVTGVEQGDAAAFRLAAALRPASVEALVFLALQPSFPDVPTAHGMVDALGFATPGRACAYVSFLPAQPQLCRVLNGLKPVQPSYAYLAHELGHLLGLTHTPGGLMGKGVFDLCSGDTFTAAQKAQLKSWGR